jgi:hypothetical protein
MTSLWRNIHDDAHADNFGEGSGSCFRAKTKCIENTFSENNSRPPALLNIPLPVIQLPPIRLPMLPLPVL